MNELTQYFHFYIGCNTTRGKFLGIKKNILFIQTEPGIIEEHDIKTIGHTLFLYLRKLNDLTSEQSKQLVKDGLVIGRPHGYTFTSLSFLYLITLSVDLFGLIDAGYAKDLKTLEIPSIKIQG